jgi:hypothetical protein
LTNSILVMKIWRRFLNHYITVKTTDGYYTINIDDLSLMITVFPLHRLILIKLNGFNFC